MPPLSAEEAAAVYRELVRRTWQTVGRVSGAQVEVALEPAGALQVDTHWIDAKFPPPFFLQGGKDLGSRLTAAARRIFQAGPARLIIIGTDCPQLEPGMLQNAFEQLKRHDLVLGPAKDGGYYLIGMCQERPEIFEGISWSTSRVLEQTKAQATRLGLSVGYLPQLTDIDIFADLLAFQDHFIGK